MKLAVFCIDGLEPSVVLGHKERFPFFRNLIENGLHAELLDTELCGSLGKWITFLTGASFNYHGVEEGARNYYFPTLQNIRKFEEHFIWNVLNRHGYSVGLANFYGMYPAPELDGFSWCEPQCLLSGKGNGFSEQEMIYPRDLVDDFAVMTHPEIDEPRSLAQLGVKGSWADLKSDPAPLEKVLVEDYYREFTETIARRTDWTFTRLARYCDKFSPDVLLYYNWDLDKAQHFSWHEASLKNIVLSYQHVDRLLNRVCDHCRPDNILVFSDHGQNSFKNLLRYDSRGLNSTMWQVYAKHYTETDYLTLSDGTKVIIGQNKGIISGTHAIKGVLLAAGKDIPRKGEMPLVPFRYMYTGVLRLLGAEKGKFHKWWEAPPGKNWFEPEPDSIPGMFQRLKKMEKEHFERDEKPEIELLEKICNADQDGQFLKFTIPSATRIGTHYFNEGMMDLARKWHRYALSLDPQWLQPHYSILNQMRLAYLDQDGGDLKSASEKFLTLVNYCAAGAGVRAEDIPRLTDQITALEKLVEERTQWAKQLEGELAARDAYLAELQAEFEEKAAWATRLQKEIEERDNLIAKLQPESRKKK